MMLPRSCFQITWCISLASGQDPLGDIIFPLNLHFKLVGYVGNEPVQKANGEVDKILKQQYENKPDRQDEEILTVEVIRLDGLEVLLVPNNEILGK